MKPAKLEAAPRELRGVAGVGACVQVTGPAIDAQFVAYVAACARAGHGVKARVHSVKREQVLDQVAAAIAGVAAVAVIAGLGVVVEARQAGYGTGVPGRAWQSREHRLLRL